MATCHVLGSENGCPHTWSCPVSAGSGHHPCSALFVQGHIAKAGLELRSVWLWRQRASWPSLVPWPAGRVGCRLTLWFQLVENHRDSMLVCPHGGL